MGDTLLGFDIMAEALYTLYDKQNHVTSFWLQ